MKTILKCIPVACLLAITAAAQWTPYTQTVTSATSVTILGSTHGKTDQLNVRVLDSNGYVRPRSSYSVTKNSSRDITISWTNAFTGTVQIRGGFSYTSNSWDFEPTFSQNGGGYSVMTICSACTSSSYAFRTVYDGNSFGMGRSISFEHSGAAHPTVVRAWIEGGKIVFGTSNSSGGFCSETSTGQCEVRTNISSFPSGVAQLGEGTTSAQFGWSSTSDKRQF